MSDEKHFIGVTPPNDWLKERIITKLVTPKPLGSNNFDDKPPPAVAMAITNDGEVYDKVVNPRTMEDYE